MWYCKEPLKECPFCGNIELKCYCLSNSFDRDCMAYIKCKQCGATQGWQWKDTAEEACYYATNKWNLRQNS